MQGMDGWSNKESKIFRTKKYKKIKKKKGRKKRNKLKKVVAKMQNKLLKMHVLPQDKLNLPLKLMNLRKIQMTHVPINLEILNLIDHKEIQT